MKKVLLGLMAGIFAAVIAAGCAPAVVPSADPDIQRFIGTWWLTNFSNPGGTGSYVSKNVSGSVVTYTQGSYTQVFNMTNYGGGSTNVMTGNVFGTWNTDSGAKKLVMAATGGTITNTSYSTGATNMGITNHTALGDSTPMIYTFSLSDTKVRLTDESDTNIYMEFIKSN